MRLNTILSIILVILVTLTCVVAGYALNTKYTVTVSPRTIRIAAPAATPAPITCGYRQTFLAEVNDGNPDIGISRPAGTIITGPAIAQQDHANATVIYPGASWKTSSKVITWEYSGDVACLEAQLQFFPGKNLKRIKP